MNAIQSQLDLEPIKETKPCNGCGKVLPLSCYSMNSHSGAYFLRSTCDMCRKHSSDTKKIAVKMKGYIKPPVGTPCACCGVPMTRDTSMTGMCFDHSTKTAKFRGWICKKDNTMIGYAGDTVEGIQKLLDYLIKHEKP